MTKKTCNAFRRAKAGAIALLLIGIIIPPANGQDDAAPLSFQGFGGWSFRQTDDNSYNGGSIDSDYDDFQFSLNVSTTSFQNLQFFGQLSWENNALDQNIRVEDSIDYAFAEYTVSDLLKFRFGKVKTPLGLFGEIQNVGTLRAMFDLPQALYGPVSIMTDGYVGAGVTGTWLNESEYGIQYDAFFGELDNPTASHFQLLGLIPLGFAPPGTPVFTSADVSVRDGIGGRVNFLTPLGLTAGISGYRGHYEADSVQQAAGAPGYDTILVFGAHVEYLTEQLSLRAEYFQQSFDRLDYTQDSFYVEAAYRLPFKKLDGLQVAARYELLNPDLVGLPSSVMSLLEHEEISLGVNYWFSPRFVMKASVHFTEGNRLALPKDVQTIVTTGFSEDTRLILLGAQYSF